MLENLTFADVEQLLVGALIALAAIGLWKNFGQHRHRGGCDGCSGCNGCAGCHDEKNKQNICKNKK